jgi:glycosyltransferase involved in cell wall biosynthesis
VPPSAPSPGRAGSAAARVTQAYADSLEPFDRSVTAICWAYNEEQLIGPYLHRLNALLARTVEDYEIVLIDDCSTDGTAAIIAECQKTMPRLRCHRNARNENVGPSFARAIQSATKRYLFWQTIDWSYDIRLLRVFLEFLRSHDIVAGARRAPAKAADPYVKAIFGLLALLRVRHLTRRSDNVVKAIVSVFNYLLVRLLFRIPVSDYQNVCIYPTSFIQSIRYESTSSFVNPEGLFKAYWSGKSIVEVPINFIPRTAGEAKGTRLRSILASIHDILRLWLKWIVLGRMALVDRGTVRRLVPEEWEDL